MKPSLSFWLLPIAFVAVAAAACSPPTPETPPAREPPPPQQTPPIEALPRAILSARESLATRLGIPSEQVRVLEFERVDWPDACLGINTPGMMCAQVITPGFRVLLEAAGKRYEVRTDLEGRNVRLAHPTHFESIDGE